MEDINQKSPHRGEQPRAETNGPKPRNRVAEIYTRLAETNPRFKIAKSAGQGYVIGGVGTASRRRANEDPAPKTGKSTS